MSDQIITTINPHTLDVIEAYPVLTAKEIQQKLEKARKSYVKYRFLNHQNRRYKMLKVAEILKTKKTDLAALITAEMGKVTSEAIAEIEKSALCCTYFAEEAEQMLNTSIIETDTPNQIVYEPLGAILAVMPWNFPFWQVFRFASSAVMAGNVVLLKHAPNVSGCALMIEKIFEEAGFENVLQTLIIPVKDIKKIISDNFVQGVTLTGSERAGASLAALAGKNIKKSVLELGGNDALMVLDDADVVQAAQIAVKSRMQNAGQSCIAAKRFMVADKNYEVFLNATYEAIKQIKQGNPTDPSVQMGPMARLDLADNLYKQLQDAVSKGAVVVQGGLKDNCHFQPTLLTGCTANMSVFKEETFGPLACIFKVKNENEMLRLVNQSRYGLGCSIWTKDIERGRYMARFIETGNVFINKMVKSDPKLPFGGIKKSGFGREMGMQGILEFTNTKVISF